MSNKMTAKRGENTELFNVHIEGISDYTDYSANLVVLNAKTNESVISSISIPVTENKFAVALTPDQTLNLPVDSYIMVLEILKVVGGVTQFRKELSWPLKITESLINP
jgi:hypothetical protein